jgi:hypothetical protein
MDLHKFKICQLAPVCLLDVITFSQILGHQTLSKDGTAIFYTQRSSRSCIFDRIAFLSFFNYRYKKIDTRSILSQKG